jgi:hypothetical protein
VRKFAHPASAETSTLSLSRPSDPDSHPFLTFSFHFFDIFLKFLFPAGAAAVHSAGGRGCAPARVRRRTSAVRWADGRLQVGCHQEGRLLRVLREPHRLAAVQVRKTSLASVSSSRSSWVQHCKYRFVRFVWKEARRESPTDSLRYSLTWTRSGFIAEPYLPRKTTQLGHIVN